MRFLIITLALISFFSTWALSQDLDLVTPKPKTTALPSSDSTLGIELLDDIEDIELSGSTHPENRDPDTYRKQKYLDEIVRLTYYQKLTTPAWAKFLSPNIWKKSVMKWRYWDQLKDYITGNEEDLIQIREKLEIREDTITTYNEDTSIIMALVEDISLQSRLENLANISEEELIEESDDGRKDIETTMQNAGSNERNVKPVKDKSREESATSMISKPAVKAESPPVTEKPIVTQPKERTEKKVEESREAETRAVKKATKKSGQPVISRSTLNNIFRKQKGFLPWPVRNGRITDKFGFRRNAAARGLKPENYGIDMSCPPGSSINAVHDGVVLMAVRQAPYDYIVTIKHGDYTSAYFFLTNTAVKPGDQVVVGQSIGRLKSGVNEADFHFEIWDNQNRVNPEFWLKKR